MVMSKMVIKLVNISKSYVVHHEKPTLAENILKRKTKEKFWALKDINLEINKGVRVGIIGPNGSGKTTLLKIISGITCPTTGSVQTIGKVVSLIELSAGFQPDLTGEENILLNGLLVGMSKEEIKSKMEDIIKFADIGEFIDAPFYTYSTGMTLRLGISIVLQANPDILLLDEGLGFGDRDFQIKLQKKFEQFVKKRKTILTVSHDLNFLKKRCDMIIRLQKGKLVNTIRIN